MLPDGGVLIAGSVCHDSHMARLMFIQVQSNQEIDSEDGFVAKYSAMEPTNGMNKLEEVELIMSK